jgi:hypothetical protein
MGHAARTPLTECGLYVFYTNPDSNLNNAKLVKYLHHTSNGLSQHENETQKRFVGDRMITVSKFSFHKTMRILSSLFLGGLLLHTVSYAQDVDVEIDLDGTTITEKLAEVEKAIEFLKVKEVLADVRPVVREEHFWAMRQVVSNPKNMTEKEFKKYTAIVNRAVPVSKAYQKIMSNSTAAAEKEAETIPEGEHTFTHAEFPGYTNSSSSVLSMVDNPMTLVQRFQHSSLCYMHAPAVVQYYVIWHNRTRADPNATYHPGMIDLAVEIARRFIARQLEDHIFHDRGDFSRIFLKTILHPGSKVIDRAPDLPIEGLMDALREYGPALVSQFHVYPDFMNKSAHHHHGLPEIDPKSINTDTHAMVLVGIRTDEAADVFYLLQNWWSGKQFVEVSRAYILACEAQFHFVTTPQDSVPSGHGVHSGRMHSFELAEGLEHPERMPAERVRE